MPRTIKSDEEPNRCFELNMQIVLPIVSILLYISFLWGSWSLESGKTITSMLVLSQMGSFNHIVSAVKAIKR